MNDPPSRPALVVIHVSLFPTGANKKSGFQHGVALKLTNGLIRTGNLVLPFSDRDVARALGLLGHRKLGRGKANEALREFCRVHAPDLLLLGHADSIFPETIAAIRADLPRLRVVQWNVDPLFDADNVSRLRSKAPVVNATLVSTAGEDLAPLRHPGMRLGFLPNPVDASIERGTNHLQPELPFNLFYVCGQPPLPPRRICGTEWDLDAFFPHLLAQVPNARPLFAGVMGKPPLSGARYQEALESAAIGLNISRRASGLLYSSDRLAQMIGNGQAVAIERTTGYDRLFTNDQMVFFDSVEHLAGELRDLINDQPRRQAIAAAGRARYFELFNEREIARYILDVAFDRHDPSCYEWPTLIA
jgi:hypothetical protein